MIRDEILDFASFRFPDDWGDLTRSEINNITSKFALIDNLESVNLEEATLLIKSLSVSDLDGIGESIIELIANSNPYPHKFNRYFYYNYFSDPIFSLKNLLFFNEGKYCLSLHNDYLLDQNNYNNVLVNKDLLISSIDLQIIISIFLWDNREDVQEKLISNLAPKIKLLIEKNSNLSIEIRKSPYAFWTLKRVFGIDFDEQ